MEKIKEHCADEIEGVHASLREGSFPDKNADPKEVSGLIVTLTEQSHPEFITSLRDEGSAWFELPTTEESFGGMANVRVTRVRAWIHGLKTDNNIHVVTITHCGPETIVTTENKPTRFQHDPVTVTFRYDASKGMGNPRAIFAGQGAPHDGVILGACLRIMRRSGPSSAIARGRSMNRCCFRRRFRSSWTRITWRGSS